MGCKRISIVKEASSKENIKHGYYPKQLTAICEGDNVKIVDPMLYELQELTKQFDKFSRCNSPQCQVMRMASKVVKNIINEELKKYPSRIMG